MINFRYHVVSLTAVFLSLAVGLVLGSTVLNGPMMDALNNQLTSLGQTNQQLREQVSFLEEEANREETFAAEAAPRLLEGTLTGRRVALVVLPGAEDHAGNVAETLELAGADLTGTIQLTDQFVQPAHYVQLLDLSHNLLPPSIESDDLPANSDGVETSAALLSSVLLDRPGAEPDAATEPGEDDEPAAGDEQAETGVPEGDRRQVLAGYAAAEYLTREDDVESAAEVVVMVAALPFTDADAAEKNEALLTTSEQFAQAGPLVVTSAGPSGDGNLVTEIRSHVELSDAVSTVDNMLTSQGLVATGLVVADQLADRTGHYGDGDDAESLLPDANP